MKECGYIETEGTLSLMSLTPEASYQAFKYTIQRLFSSISPNPTYIYRNLHSSKVQFSKSPLPTLLFPTNYLESRFRLFLGICWTLFRHL